MTFPTPQRRAALILAGILGLVGASCQDDPDRQPGEGLLELRPVLEESKPPCSAPKPAGRVVVLPERKDGTVSGCLELGEPIVEATDVRSATLADTPAGDAAVSIVLGQTGSANLDGFARRSLGKRLAIVVDGDLVSAPTVNFTSFAGRVQITGLSKEKSADFFERLNTVIDSPS